MTVRLTILRLVLASPSDVEAEWKVVAKVVAELNHGLARELGYRIDIATWRTDAFPGFHAEGAQGQIDDNLRIDDSDILLAIFWTHFGTPVADAESGTQHEIMRAIRAWKIHSKPQVMVYFKTAAYSPSDQYEHEQWAKVRSFRDSFPETGLWASFKTKPQFETQLRFHLTNFIRAHKPAKRRRRVNLSDETALSVVPIEEANTGVQTPAVQIQSIQQSPLVQRPAVQNPIVPSPTAESLTAESNNAEDPTDKETFQHDPNTNGESVAFSPAEPPLQIHMQQTPILENAALKAMLQDTMWHIRCKKCAQKSKWVRLRSDGLVEFRYGNDNAFRFDGDDKWRIESDQLIIEWSSGYSIETFKFILATQTTALGTKSNVRGPLRITRVQ